MNNSLIDTLLRIEPSTHSYDFSEELKSMDGRSPWLVNLSTDDPPYFESACELFDWRSL